MISLGMCDRNHQKCCRFILKPNLSKVLKFSIMSLGFLRRTKPIVVHPCEVLRQQH